MKYSEKQKFHIFRLLRSIALNFVGPFVSIYAHYLGFSNSFIGFYSGLAEIFGDVSRFIAGYVLRLIGDAKKFAAYIVFLWSLVWVIFPFAKTELLFTLVVVIESILRSSFIVSYLVLIVSFFTGNKKINDITKLSLFTALGVIIGNFLSGIMIYVYGFSLYVFAINSLISLLSLYIFNKINFGTTRKMYPKHNEKLKLNLRRIFSDRRFSIFTTTASLFYFSVGISASYFPVFLVSNMHLTAFHWALINIIEMISFVIFNPYISSTIRWLGYRRSFLVGSMLLSLTPFIWVYFENYTIILIWSFITGITTGMYSVTLTSYLSSVIKRSHTEEKSGLFFLIYGASLSLGYFTGSLLAKLFSLEQIMYISFIVRIVFSSTFVFIGKQRYDISEFAASLPKIIVKRTLLSFYVLSKMLKQLGNDLKNTEIKFL